MTPTRSAPKYTTVVRPVILNDMLETPVLATTQGAYVVEVVPHANVSKRHAHMMAKEVMDVYQSLLFYITVANFCKVDVTPLDH